MECPVQYIPINMTMFNGTESPTMYNFFPLGFMWHFFVAAATRSIAPLIKISVTPERGFQLY
jgi:hypothetical protein